MGTPYTTTSVTGFNSNPPADDGSAVAGNQLKWSNHINKIGGPLKTAIEAINTKLVAMVDSSVHQVIAAYTTVLGDHMRTVEIASTVTNTITVKLGDAATMAAGYIVTVKNSSAVAQTVGRDTSGDTIDGAAANVTLAAGESITLSVNASANGYLSIAGFDKRTPNVVAITSTGTYTRSAWATYGFVYLKGAGASGGGSSSSTANGGGGGEGEEAFGIFTAAEIGTSQTVTIGSGGVAISGNTNQGGNDGGTSSFGSLMTAAGGKGGVQGNLGGMGGHGGTGGTGADWAIPGANGANGSDTVASIKLHSQGGGQGAGDALYGAVGNSGAGGMGGSTAIGGGAGADGFCLVIEY